MTHRHAPRKEHSALNRQFGDDTMMPAQMGDMTMSFQDHENAKENVHRGMRTEERGFTLQMNG